MVVMFVVAVSMDSVVLEKIYDMVVLCEARDYRRAHDK